jgi:hypothetical protein
MTTHDAIDTDHDSEISYGFEDFLSFALKPKNGTKAQRKALLAAVIDEVFSEPSVEFPLDEEAMRQKD